MTQLMRLGYDETLEKDGILYVVEFRHSKADGITFDVYDNTRGTLFCQSVWSYDALYKARKDARRTLAEIGGIELRHVPEYH